MTPSVCVVLPTYNEAENIGPLIDAITAELSGKCDLKIVVVDDNSPDGTYRLVNDRTATQPYVSAVLRTTEPSLANSIRAGIEATTSDYVVVMDTDFTHDPRELPKLLHVAQIFDLVSGSRFCAGGRMQDTGHYLASLMYNWMIRIVLRTQIQDNLGGYFIARRDRLASLPFDRIFFGYGDYYFRLLYFAEASGWSIAELPSQYMSRRFGQSKSNWAVMMLRYTMAAIRLRLGG